VRADKKTPLKADKKVTPRGHKRGVIGYSKKSALLEDAITQMNAGKYGRSSAALKELLALDPLNMEARRLFATLHLRLGSLLPARQAFESLANEALERQDYWLAESLLREYLVAGPRCVPFIEKLGAVYQEKGDALAAAEEFAKAIDILIEDPDTDRPARPAELYAKIRELAPASPPAFRLASLFDAQSGELIARAPVQEPVVPQVSSAAVESVESSEPTLSDLSPVMADPVPGVMPWDDVPVGASAVPVPGVQPESPEQVALSQAAPFELKVELPAEPLTSLSGDNSLAEQEALIDRAPGESGDSLSLPNPSSDHSSPVAPHEVDSTRLPLTHQEMTGAVGTVPGSELAIDSLPPSQDSRNPVSSETTFNETTGAAEAGRLSLSDTSTILPAPKSDVPPAPLPWEQVQEATIAIPQPDSDLLSVNLITTDAAPAATPEVSSVEPVHSQESDGQASTQPSVTLSVGGETTLSSGTTQEFSPDIAWSAPDTPAMEQESSTSSSPETALTSSVVQVQSPDTMVEVVPPPMPWEQVEEAAIRIDGSDQESISVQAEPAEPSPAQSRADFSAEIATHIAPEAVTATFDLGDDRESREAASASTADGLAQTVPSPGSTQSPTVGEFSWASIFNSAWKFGSSSPAPHDSLQHASPVELSIPAEPVLHQGQVGAAVHPEDLTAHGNADGLAASSTPVSAGSAVDASTPLPWEQIQDAPVTIPPAESALNPSVEPEIGPFAIPGGSAQSSDQAPVQSEPVLSPAFQEDSTSEPNSAPTPESMSAAVSQADSAVPPMPWEQIADAAITIPPAEIDLSSTVESTGVLSDAPVEISEGAATQDTGATTQHLHEERMVVVPSSEEIPESGPEAINQAGPAVLPTRSDQIHSTVVTTATADSALGSTVESPIDGLHQTADQGATQFTISAESPEVSANVLIETPRPAEVMPVESTEPSFRFLDSKHVVTESNAATETPQPQHLAVPDEGMSVSQPAVSPSQGDAHTSVHSDEFRIASCPEPAPAIAELSKPDVPVLPIEPASRASVSVEPAPPVLPQELIPVLQTLVDQLSVVTKTIPAISSETKSAEVSSRDQEVAPDAASLREPSKVPSSAELAGNPSSAQVPPTEEGPPSQWKTGEVAVQTHRSSATTRKHVSGPSPEPSPAPLAEQAYVPAEPVTEHISAVIEPMTSASVKEQEEWIRTGEAIRFVDPQSTDPTHLSAPPPVGQEEWQAVPTAASTAASAVDVLFQSSGQQTRTQTIERPAVSKPRPRISAKLARVRISLSVFVGSCFSTTRALITSIVGLAVLCVAMLAVAIGAVGLTWLVMEEKPSPAFQSLTTTPQRAMLDSSKNGYLLLLGFEADAAADPVQAGYERKPDHKDGEMASVCLGGDEGMAGANQQNASASVAQGWYRSADPTGQFKVQADSLKGWMSQANTSVARYRQWLKMPFEDWGHGQAVTPPCAAILFAHRLHVAEGFNQGANTEGGVERLESDMEVWRTTLGQAKTLPVKMMALQAINDDIAVASGLLVKPDFDGKALPRITKMLRPLDPVESSMRWPMQSQLVLATKSYETQLDADRGEDVPFHVRVAGMLPLPKQRRFNDYAEYYEASYKTAGEGRYGAMPKRSTYIKHPANGFMDYLTNPIENIIGVDPLPAWDHYNGLVIDTDAHLRLASLQAWLRRGPQDADLLARIAKAGQRLYDPYTGLPMLVNLKRGVMYSVGHDGKDQDADPQQDVVVSIPLNQSATIAAKPAPKSK